MAALPESNVAEGLALLKGMEFAKEMLFLNLKVEADSSNVIKAINEVQTQQSYLGSIIEDCKSFVSNFPSIEFCHIRQ
jgi:ribonuclease HI